MTEPVTRPTTKPATLSPPTARPGGTRQADPGQCRGPSWLLGAAAIFVSTTFFVLFVPDLRHWFVLPVALCGVLIAPDAVDWARRRLDTFDPQALLGLMGVHFFYLAPLLHVVTDYWALYVPPSADWRNALGEMAMLNLVGLILYRIVIGPPSRDRGGRQAGFDTRKLYPLTLAAIVLSLITFLYVVEGFGGFSGYLTTFADNRDQLSGLGPTLLISGAFPLLGFMLLLVRFRTRLRRHPWVLFGLIVLYAVALIVAGGLRGSRSFTVWALVIALGLIHMLVRPIRRRALACAFLAVVGFMYVYGFYKNVGGQALGIFTGEKSTAELTGETGRDVRYLLLGDLGRADIQALVLERQREGSADLGQGISYVGDLSFLVPRSVLPDRPPDKVEVGTNMVYGRGTYDTGFHSSQIYGLAGEATLNFGAPGAVLSFVPLGLFIRLARVRYRRARTGDSLAAKLLTPTLTVCVLLMLGSDLDNLAWYLVNQVSVLACIVLLCRRPAPTEPSPHEPTARNTRKGGPVHHG